MTPSRLNALTDGVVAIVMTIMVLELKFPEEPTFAARIAAEVRELAVTHNGYRGHVVSFDHDMFGQRDTVLSVHTRPVMTGADLILPAETTRAITRQVIGVARHSRQLRAARQHLKRGLLLYVPPG